MDFQPLYRKQNLCNVVKYIAALLVVNGHLFQYGGGNPNIIQFMNIGACCVGVFFFFSAYGLTYSYKTKGADYLTSFFRKRLSRLIIPLITAYAITLPIYAMLIEPINIVTLFSTMLWGGPYLKFSWFVSEIAIVYILFYISMRMNVKCNMKNWILSGLISIMLIFIISTHKPLWYAVSLPAFIIGIWYGEYEHKIKAIYRHSGFIISTLIISSVWYLCWQWNTFGGNIFSSYRYAFIASFLSVILFTVLVVILLSYINPIVCKNNFIKSFYEVYLLQNAGFIIAKSCSSSFLQYWILSFAIIIPIAFIMNNVNNRISKILYN